MTYFDEILNLSKSLIAYESIYGNGGFSKSAVFGKTIVECQKAVLRYCESLGFKTYLDPEGMYSYAEVGEGEEYVALLAHLDVVDAGDLSQWHSKPFEATIVEDKLLGRGSADDKVPAAIGILAVKKLIDDGIKLKYPIRLIFGSDEETGFRGLDKYKRIHGMPKYTLVVDGTFPFSYSEKHLLNYELIVDTDIELQGGVGYNSVMESVTWKYGGETIKVVGRSAHASRPTQGENALVKLSYMEAGQNTMFDKINDLLDPSGNHKLDFLKEPYFKNETTLNLGMVKDHVIYADVRVPPELDLDFFIESFEKTMSQMGLKAVKKDVLKGSITDTSSPYAQTVLKCYQEISGDYKSEPFRTGSATYGRMFDDNCLSFGPRMGYHITNIHKPNEFVPFDLIKNAFKIYVHTLKTIEEEL